MWPGGMEREPGNALERSRQNHHTTPNLRVGSGGSSGRRSTVPFLALVVMGVPIQCYLLRQLVTANVMDAGKRTSATVEPQRRSQRSATSRYACSSVRHHRLEGRSHRRDKRYSSECRLRRTATTRHSSSAGQIIPRLPHRRPLRLRIPHDLEQLRVVRLRLITLSRLSGPPRSSEQRAVPLGPDLK